MYGVRIDALDYEDARQGCSFRPVAHYFIAKRDGHPLRLSLGGKAHRRPSKATRPSRCA
jgi:hypothetical protein